MANRAAIFVCVNYDNKKIFLGGIGLSVYFSLEASNGLLTPMELSGELATGE